MTGFPFPKTAILFGTLLLCGYGVVGWITANDRRERQQLEVFESPTAAGMEVILPENWPPAADQPALSVKGAPYYIHEVARVRERRDWEMLPRGKDDTGRVPLFGRAPKKDRKDDPRLYLKVGPGQYHELRQAPAPSAPSASPAVP